MILPLHFAATAIQEYFPAKSQIDILNIVLAVYLAHCHILAGNGITLKHNSDSFLLKNVAHHNESHDL